MVTPRLPPECQDCEQAPRVGRSTRCADCRTKHCRASKTAAKKRTRDRNGIGRQSAATVSATGPQRPGLDADVQERIRAVEPALQYSTPYLDGLHVAIRALLQQLSLDR